jgi:hypothetical protein
MIIKSLLPNSYANEIKSALMSDVFPWYFNEHIIPENKSKSCQFTHTIIKNNEYKSDIVNLIKPIIYFIEDKTNIQIKNIHRIKANLRTQENISTNCKYTIHQDINNINYKSFVYYVNDSDGETILFDDNKLTEKLRIFPVSNNGILFDSKTWHTSSAPINYNRRIVINFIFEVNNE